MGAKIGVAALLFVLFLFTVYAEDDACDYAGEILLDDDVFTTEEFTFKVRAYNVEGPKTLVTGRAFVLDDDGETIKEYLPFTDASITRKKTSGKYTPNFKDGRYTIAFEVDVACSETDMSNNHVEALFDIENEDSDENEVEEENEEEEESSSTTTTTSTTSTTSTSLVTTTTTTSSTTTTIQEVEEKPETTISGRSDDGGFGSGDIVEKETELENVNVQQAHADVKVVQQREALGVSGAVVAKTKASSAQSFVAQEVVYESSSITARHVAIGVFVFLLLMISVVLIWRR